MAGIRKCRSDQLKTKSSSFAKSILKLSKTVPDKVDVILSMWSGVAIPSLLYCCEVLELTDGCIQEIEKWQHIIGKSALQVPSHSANEIVNVDLGLKLSFYHRISSPDFNGSKYI